jgi:hypothetical protein
VLLTIIAHATEGSISRQGLWLAGADADREVWTYLVAWDTAGRRLVDLRSEVLADGTRVSN